jgi:hypothetical protein
MNTEMKDAHLAGIIKVERKRRNLTREHLAQVAELDVRTIQGTRQIRLKASGWMSNSPNPPQLSRS